MDQTLFGSLITEIEYLINVMQMAPNKISALGIEHNRPTTDEYNQWHQLIQVMKDKKNMLKQNIEKDNLSGTEKPLTFFRTLSKLFDAYPYYWSAYLNEINEAHDKVSATIHEIDIKYTLGQEKFRQMEKTINIQIK